MGTPAKLQGSRIKAMRMAVPRLFCCKLDWRPVPINGVLPPITGDIVDPPRIPLATVGLSGPKAPHN